MPSSSDEIVYGLHTFTAENPDELSFYLGEAIVVLEKDDMYGDGWWQGRNTKGQEGLFPVSYTSTIPPPTHAVPPISDGPVKNSPPSTSVPALSLPPSSPPTVNGNGYTNGHLKDPSSPSVENHPDMSSTMTDIQNAIESLGVNHNPSAASINGDNRSLHSYASRDLSNYATSEHGHLPTDDEEVTKTPNGNGADEAFSSVATRKRLADAAVQENLKREEKARKLQLQEQEEEARTAAAAKAGPWGGMLSTNDFSDESDDEEEDEAGHHPGFTAAAGSSFGAPDSAGVDKEVGYEVPEVEQPDSAPKSQEMQQSISQVMAHPSISSIAAPAAAAAAVVGAAAASTAAYFNGHASSAVPSATSTPAAISEPKPITPSSATKSPFESAHHTPSPSPAPEPVIDTAPAAATTALAPAVTASVEPAVEPTPSTELQPAIALTPEIPQSASMFPKTPENPIPVPAPQSVTGLVITAPPPPSSTTSAVSGPSLNQPSSWTLQDVLEWCGMVGFPPGSLVYAKFEENEITGDVLLEMGDLGVLKEEIGINAFGVRVKLVKAINELKAKEKEFNVGAGSIATSEEGSLMAPNGRSAPASASGIESPLRTGGTFASSGVGSVISGNNGAFSEGSYGLGLNSNDQSSPRTPSTWQEEPSSHSHTHTRQASGVDSLVGSRIDEDVVGEANSGSSNKFGLDDSSATPSPSSVSKRTGSVSHKRGNSTSGPPPIDRERTGSFVGNLMGGGSKYRKPAPRMSNGSIHDSKLSPDLSGSSSRNGSFTKSPSTTFRRGSRTPLAEAMTSPAATLKKRMSVADQDAPMSPPPEVMGEHDAARALDRIPKPDFQGPLRKKGERYNTWKVRFFALSGEHLYYLKTENDAKFKGYINMTGYKIIADENTNPGFYGFRIVHDTHPPHYFSSTEQSVVREWMKTLMKATISRDYSSAVVSSCNIPTMSLKEAQSMNPAPRPPSPSQQLATQRAARRDNPNQLTARDASVLMGLPPTGRVTEPRQSVTAYNMPAPARPTRGERGEVRKPSGGSISSLPAPPPPAILSSPPMGSAPLTNLQWVNAHLPLSMPRVISNPTSFQSGLVLVRLTETVTKTKSGIPDDAFHSANGRFEEQTDLLYQAFDYFIDAGIDMDGMHVDDVVRGNPVGIDAIINSIRKRAADLQKLNLAG